MEIGGTCIIYSTYIINIIILFCVFALVRKMLNLPTTLN